MNRIVAAADYLLGLRRGRRRVPGLPPELAPASLPEAYRIQAAFVGRLLQLHGGQTIGYKVAGTSRHAQKLLGIDHPLFGRLLSATSYPSGSRVAAADYCIRCIEVEFAVEIAEDVPPDRHWDQATIQPYVAAVIPSIEIVDHRFEDWQTVGAATLAADNAIHGGWIYGDPCLGWRDYDLAAVPTTLIVNGTPQRHGSGAAVLGHPLAVLAWLANTLPQFGLGLRRGERVTTGITTEIYLAAPGDHLVGDFGPLGQVTVQFV